MRELLTIGKKGFTSYSRKDYPMTKTQLVPPYRPYKNYTMIRIYQPAEPDYPVIFGYVSHLEITTFMVKQPIMKFRLFMLPTLYMLPVESIENFSFSDNNELIINLKSQDTTVIRMADR